MEMLFLFAFAFVCSMFAACKGPEAFHTQSAGLGNSAGAGGQAGGGGAPGTAGDTSVGTAGVTGTAGDNGMGLAGTMGTAGDNSAGTAGASGTAGMGTAGMGTAGAGGAAGMGTAGAGGAAGMGAAGAGGAAGMGGAGGTAPQVVKLDAGGLTNVQDWLADVDFTGGVAAIHANTIDMSGVTNPAPEAVYQTSRAGSAAGTFSYTVPGFTAGSSHTVRLHFCETYFGVQPNTTGPGSRTCSVSINGTMVLTNYDIYVKAGTKNKAVVEQFTQNADGTGQYVIQFTPKVNYCFLAGIEIL